MRIILDTNVLISGIFFSGPPSQILQSWRDGIVQVVISPDILDEYRRVSEILAKDHPSIEFHPILNYVIQKAEIYSVPTLPQNVSKDADDDKFVACALASGARMIISGDKHLLEVSGYQGIEVLKPREFVDQFLK